MVRNRRPDGGFTLIEMIIVVMMIAILVTIALPQLRVSVISAREAVLKEDLYNFRRAIDQYQADKGVYPPSLDTLVEEGYLRKREPDPMTGTDDWTVELSEPDANAPDQAPGVYDVHSSSDASSLAGPPYKEW
jgi:general secretion pathway protein G